MHGCLYSLFKILASSRLIESPHIPSRVIQQNTTKLEQLQKLFPKEMIESLQ